MSRILGLFLLLAALCCTLAGTVERQRAKRGTRFYRVLCKDSKTSAVRNYGDTWMRWRGPQAEYCRCASRGRERCYYVPVVTCQESRCYNGGVCKETLYTGTGGFLCQCRPGYSGTQCEINTKEKCVSGRGEAYRGMWSVSYTRRACINWNSTSLRGKSFTARKPNASSLGLGNHNFCRNPDNDSVPWCYVYKGAQVDWQYCSVEKCPENKEQECVRGAGQTYRGSTAVSRGGARCLAWDSPHIRRRLYTAWRGDALKLGLGSHSYCRNPDGDASPWCYIVKNSQVIWELCDVTPCPKRPTFITTLGPRAPTGDPNGATCGQRQDNSLNGFSFRIFGGRQSDITEQPWQVAINANRNRKKKYLHLCGGILIDSCWVLSAAHCFEEGYNASELQAVLGRTFRKQNSSREQIFQVERLWVHQDFDKETFDNDIALLKLKTDIGICAVHSPEVLPVCLPEPGLVLPDWTECEISGYGKDAEFDAEFSERVKRGFVRLWPQERCVPEVLAGRTVTDNMLCAGDTRGLDDACKGDSGGPLVCPSRGRMTLMGVISWGDGCGKKDTPGVYTRVTHYLDWINSKMAEDPVF